MAKGGGTQTVTQTTDPATQAYTQQIRDAAQQAGGSPAPGLSPYTTQAGDLFSQYARGGNLGFSALSGDPTAMASFMNPYQQNVIDRLNSSYGDIRKSTMGAVDDAATSAGAFGGDRHGVATGVALGQVGKDQANQIAQLLYGGYNDAAGRAGQVANLGFGAGGALGSLGEYTRGVAMDQDPNIWRLKMLQQGLGAPYGTSQVMRGNPGRNPGAGALGGAATGAEIGSTFGPWGAGIGGGIGGLLGLFS